MREKRREEKRREEKRREERGGERRGEERREEKRREEKRREAYKILVGNPERDRPLAKPRRRCENNIRMDLRETRWEVVEWMRLRTETSGGLL
jgi:hypothetical protein